MNLDMEQLCTWFIANNMTKLVPDMLKALPPSLEVWYRRDESKDARSKNNAEAIIEEHLMSLPQSG